MSGNLNLYTLIYAAVDGALLVEETGVDMQRMTNAQIIHTVAKGFSGVSPGAKECTIQVENAVPSKDFELDPGPYMKGLKNTVITLQGPGGRQATSNGFILEDSVKHSTGAVSALSFKFHGTFPDWI